jgi:uncharacterized low-complexity protein
MSISTNKTTIALAASAALTAGLALSPLTVSADTNPFVSTELSSGYMQLAEGKCGEAKCGANKKAEHEAKCGEEMGEKAKEGKCGEAKCGADKKATEKMEEGKCGEAKCGANK